MDRLPEERCTDVRPKSYKWEIPAALLRWSGMGGASKLAMAYLWNQANRRPGMITVRARALADVFGRSRSAVVDWIGRLKAQRLVIPLETFADGRRLIHIHDPSQVEADQFEAQRLHGRALLGMTGWREPQARDQIVWHLPASLLEWPELGGCDKWAMAYFWNEAGCQPGSIQVRTSDLLHVLGRLNPRTGHEWLKTLAQEGLISFRRASREVLLVSVCDPDRVWEERRMVSVGEPAA